MKTSQSNRDRPHFELRQVWSDGTEKIEICSLQDLVSQVEQISMSRRGFLGLSAVAATAALITACSPTPTPTPTPTPKPSPTPTPTPIVVEAKEKCSGLEAHRDTVSSIAISPDGKLLASASGDSTIKLWNLNDGSLVRELKGHTRRVNSVAFSPEGSLVASGSLDNTVRLWRVSDGSLVRELKGHTDWVRSVAFSPDGSLVASGSNDNTVRLWRVSDGSMVSELKGHEGIVNSVAFSPDGSLVASGSADKTVRLWRVSGSLEPDICFFDPAATPSEQKASTYKVTDAYGITRTYTLPCGSPIPAGAVCTCNCIPGAYAKPTPAPTQAPTRAPAPGSRPGGVICTCDKVCVCIPVRKYCFVMFK